MNHVQMAQHVLANAPTRREGELIVDRMFGMIMARRSWWTNPPSGVEQETIERVWDVYQS